MKRNPTLARMKRKLKGPIRETVRFRKVISNLGGYSRIVGRVTALALVKDIFGKKPKKDT